MYFAPFKIDFFNVGTHIQILSFQNKYCWNYVISWDKIECSNTYNC